MRPTYLVALLGVPCLLTAQNRIGTGEVADLYQMHCAVCHGKELDGGLGGPLLGELDYARNDAALQMWIRSGNAALGMPAFDGVLSDPEIRSLVIYLREMRQKAERAGQPQPSPDATVFEAGSTRFTVETVVHEGLKTPWSVAFLPDQSLLITELPGRLRHFKDGQLSDPVKGIPEAWEMGQGGLMEVALHPDYAENGWIYLAFSESEGGQGSTSIVRGRLVDNEWVDQERIFSVPAEHRYPTRHHFGTRLVFQDGYLFFSIGDRGKQDTAQDKGSPNGRVHRIHDDGRIPADNPFRDDPTAFPSSWTIGNRNIQGLDAHPLTGNLWAAEHGPRGGDELNRIQPGLNYGWPTITYGMNYNGTPITALTEAPGLEQPALYWTPSIAVCGMDFYEGDHFPEWINDLFLGGLASKELHRVSIDKGKVVRDEIVLSGIGRIRDVASGPDGMLWLVLNDPDTVVRLVPIP
jgi:glucose/arabinose dehydrogenase